MPEKNDPTTTPGEPTEGERMYEDAVIALEIKLEEAVDNARKQADEAEEQRRRALSAERRLEEARAWLSSKEAAKRALSVLDPDWPSFVSPMSRADMAQLQNAKEALTTAVDAFFALTNHSEPVEAGVEEEH